MDFFTSLLKSYESAEQDGWVDNASKNEPTLLPIYHSNKILKKTDKYIEIVLDNQGNFVKATFLEEGYNLVYPVTFDSVNRTSSKIAPHPIVDKWYYVMPTEERKDMHEMYQNNLKNWLQKTTNSGVQSFLKLICDFLTTTTAVDKVLKSLFSDKYELILGVMDGRKFIPGQINYEQGTKKLELKDTMVTFKIVDFNGYKDTSVSNYLDLHLDHIKMVEQNSVGKEVCNISGKKDQIVHLHRNIGGVFVKAKLISKSETNDFAYQGDRFSSKKEDTDIIKIGYQTSEKIHLMAKYLLENEHTHAWLGGGQYLINWFSDDLANDSQLTVTKTYNSMFEEEDEDDGETSKFTISERNREIKASFIRGKKQFEDASSYYAAILNKTNDGRIALKYFRQLKASQLLERLDQWQANYSWERRRKDGQYYSYAPNLMEIILAAYGVEREEGLKREKVLKLDNDSFKSDLYQQLITALLDGQGVPSAIVKKLENNIRQRQRYPEKWHQVQQISLGILHKQHEEEFSPMLDHTNQDRSYLFGRLLAIYELIESLCYKLDGSDNGRITNAERYWTAYTNQPTKLMMLLENKIKPYEETLKLNNHGSWSKLNKEKEEIMMLLNPLIDSEGMEKPLDYRFVFGYYAEKKFYYTKQTVEVVESED